MKGIVNLPAVRQNGQIAPNWSASPNGARAQLVNAPRARTLQATRRVAKWTTGRPKASHRQAAQAYALTQRLACHKRRPVVDCYL